MKHHTLVITLVFLLIALPSAVFAGTAASGRPHSQVLVEAGWSRPYGDLAPDYTATKLGFGAGDALEIGFRWRHYLSRAISLSPAFHFVDYRDYKSSDGALGDYRISSSSLRYTLELMMIQGNELKAVRPFLGLAGGLYRNRVVGFDKKLSAPFDESVNTFGLAMRAGVRLVGFELSAAYNLNRFATWQFFQTGQDQAYNWDSFSVRAAWIVPFSD